MLESQFPIEVNVDGDFKPAQVETVIDQNNVVAIIFDGGSFDRKKVQRGTEPGEFRTRA